MRKSFVEVTSAWAQQFQEIIDAKTAEFYRPYLNDRTHVLDLSYEALKSGGALSPERYALVIKAINTWHRGEIPTFNNYEDIDHRYKLYFTQVNSSPVLVGRDFSTVSKYINTALSSSRYTSDKSSAWGGMQDGVSKTVIGHTPVDGSQELVSPGGSKLQDLELFTRSNPVLNNIVKKELEKFYKIQAKFSFVFKNGVPEAFNAAVMGNKSLGSMFVAVTVQTAKRNAEYSALEKRAIENIRKFLLGSKDLQGILKIVGSNNIKEDIAALILNSLSGNKKKLSTHPKKSSTVNSTNQAVQKVSGGMKLPKLRTVEGTFVNLTSLMRWINYSLEKQVKDNMGTGSARNILNFRTGRFAESAQVQHMTQSREGMITAFYNYMQYPYRTFEPGGRQGAPASRDPKLLISKSIREIAATIVKNRMRAVRL